jgi:hypothetical protein
MAEYTTRDAVRLAFEGNASDFRTAVSDLLMDKVYDAVEIKKHEVAMGFMSEPEDEA